MCGELGVPDLLRKLVLKEYRSPADWASQPTVPGELGRKFGWDFQDKPCNMSPIC